MTGTRVCSSCARAELDADVCPDCGAPTFTPRAARPKPRQSGLPVLLALGGGAGLIATLWLPWYALDIPSSFTEQLGARVPPEFQAFANSLLEAARGLEATGWQAFEGADVVLALAGAGILLALLGAMGRVGSGVKVDNGAAARIVTLLGSLAFGLVAYKLIDSPGPNELLQPRWGAYAALASAGAAALGGALLSSRA